MIDNFSILLSHALLGFALWHLTSRRDLDFEEPPVPDVEPEGFAGQRLQTKRKDKAPRDA